MRVTYPTVEEEIDAEMRAVDRLTREWQTIADSMGRRVEVDHAKVAVLVADGLDNGVDGVPFWVWYHRHVQDVPEERLAEMRAAPRPVVAQCPPELLAAAELRLNQDEQERLRHSAAVGRRLDDLLFEQRMGESGEDPDRSTVFTFREARDPAFLYRVAPARVRAQPPLVHRWLAKTRSGVRALRCAGVRPPR
jgi:hypothetical protein